MTFTTRRKTTGRVYSSIRKENRSRNILCCYYITVVMSFYVIIILPGRVRRRRRRVNVTSSARAKRPEFPRDRVRVYAVWTAAAAVTKGNGERPEKKK